VVSFLLPIDTSNIVFYVCISLLLPCADEASFLLMDFAYSHTSVITVQFTFIIIKQPAQQCCMSFTAAQHTAVHQHHQFIYQ
jgi:hypothetical protein